MNNELTILLIDDDQSMHTISHHHLNAAGFHMRSAFNCQQGLEILQREQVDVIILEYMMPDMSGYDISWIIQTDPVFSTYRNIPIIMLTVLDEAVIDRAKLAEVNIHFIIQKPFGFNELVTLIRNVIWNQKQFQPTATPRHQIGIHMESYDRDLKLIGMTPAMQVVIQQAKHAAKSSGNVLITGEAGTGKQYLARWIHAHSGHALHPLVYIDGRSIQSTVDTDQYGASHFFDWVAPQAIYGTVLITYIDEWDPIALRLFLKQLMIIRESQNGDAMRLIATSRTSSTNLQAVEAACSSFGVSFNQTQIDVPALRERTEDIPLLINYLLHPSMDGNSHKIEIDGEVIKLFQHYDWPENVHELVQMIKSWRDFSDKSVVTLDDLPSHLNNQGQNSINQTLDLPLKEAKKEWNAVFEKRYLKYWLRKYNGNISKVAQFAHVHRMTIYRMLDQYKIVVRRTK
ncbi:sigma-54-dependent Fis family transcriptional regulator [candidate division KSB1 bacterium]|nr:sigma-54-dependent Fis family transcriptional regulator [candidate division KSB1 bacterium]